MTAPPILASWDGECFKPRANFRKTCDANFVVGETYKIETIEERSMKSHRRYFAIVGETWKNLSEEQLERWPTPEHLRKYMLIKVGEAVQVSVACESKAEAVRFLGNKNNLDEYAVATIKDNIVTIYRAKSQAFKAMDKVAFKLCQDKILDLCAELIGVQPHELDNHARAI